MPDSTPTEAEFGLTFSAADLLVPLFMPAAKGDVVLARQMALSGIEAYHPETRADYINVARIIAFSLTSLALLGHAACPDVSMPDKMRAFGRANALNRSADQSERSMMQRRRHARSAPRADHPALRSEPAVADTRLADAEFNDAEMEASIADAVNQYVAACKRTNAQAPAQEGAETAAAPPGVASPYDRGASGLPVEARAPAIHSAAPQSAAVQTPIGSFKAGLLRHSAMPLAANGAHYPRGSLAMDQYVDDGRHSA